MDMPTLQMPPFARRSFLRSSALTAGAGAAGLLPFNASAAPDDRGNVIGPKTGYTPQVGTMVSMLTWMLGTIPPTVRGLTQADLDFLLDSQANTMGALLLHLAATE